MDQLYSKYQTALKKIARYGEEHRQAKDGIERRTRRLGPAHRLMPDKSRVADGSPSKDNRRQQRNERIEAERFVEMAL